MLRELSKRWTDYFRGEFCFYYEKYVKKDFCEPVNYGPLDSSPETIRKDVEYAMSNACIWLDLFPNGGEFFKGKKVLEIGPGINFGALLVLACHGAKVMVADRFLPPCDSNYHPKFYAFLKESMKNRWTQIDQTHLDRVLSQGQYPAEIISLCSCSLEKLSIVRDCSVDIVMSKAVLVHLYDLK